jgi:fumarate reductase subunit C
MERSSPLIAGVGLAGRTRKSRWPARLDLAQSVTGLVLVLFMWGHMFFVSSILLGKDAMWTITKFFEGYFFFGRSYPWVVSIVVAGVIALIAVHAALALRKFPANYAQYAAFRGHMKMMRHEDTTLWVWQVATGFALFFLASAHLYVMLSRPELIGPYESSDRVWSDHFWPLYLVLLFTVEMHAGIGLYRLAVKWGWLSGPSADATRVRLKRLKWAITVFFLALGLATLAAYVKIGIEHQARYGERYVPAHLAAPR